MDKIIKELNDKIREIAQSEEIDTQKLTELINTRDKLKSLNITSVSQIQRFNNPLQFNNPLPFGQNIGNGVVDTIMDVANTFFKVQKDNLENIKISNKHANIHDLIFYHNFISKLEDSHDMTTELERTDTKAKLENIIMKEFKNIILKEKNEEKDQIIKAKAEVRPYTEEDHL